MESSRSKRVAFPRWCAFLVRYGDDANLERGEVRERVEHVDSGGVARFASQQGLDAFVSEFLHEPEDGRRGPGMGPVEPSGR